MGSVESDPEQGRREDVTIERNPSISARTLTELLRGQQPGEESTTATTASSSSNRLNTALSPISSLTVRTGASGSRTMTINMDDDALAPWDADLEEEDFINQGFENVLNAAGDLIDAQRSSGQWTSVQTRPTAQGTSITSSELPPVSDQPSFQRRSVRSEGKFYLILIIISITHLGLASSR